MLDFKITTLGTAISALLALSVVAVIATSTVTVRGISDLGETWHDFESGPARKTGYLQELSAAIGYGGMIHQFNIYLLRQERTRIVEAQAKIRASTVALTAYRAVGVNTTEAGALSAIGAVLAEYADALTEAEKLVAEGKTPRQVDNGIMIDNGPAIDGIATLSGELLKARFVSSRAVYAAVDWMSAFAATVAVAIGVVLATVVAVLFWFTTFRLGRPMRQIVDTMGNLAAGDLDTEVPALDRGDEIGKMATAAQVFKDSALENIRLSVRPGTL